MKDKVFCNWCEVISIVDYDVDTCPSCNREGFLKDIEQNTWEVAK